MKADKVHKIDKKLVLRLQKGDEAAFEYVYWNYNAYVYNFVHSLLYDQQMAEDITQNVFLKLWERCSELDPDKDVESYLFTIARNFVYKEMESRLRMAFQSLDQVESLHPHDLDTEKRLEAASLEEYIDFIVEQLPPSRKEIYLMSRKDHLTNKEIAARLSLSEKTVENQITNALRFIKEKLIDEYLLLLLLFLPSV